MPRVRSPGSDDSDGDIDGMAEKEQEHQKLLRRYRIMEGDRKAYCLESQDTIQRQRQEIEQLKKEKKEVETDLRLIDSASNRTKDDRHVDDLGELGSEKDQVNAAINEELEKHNELKAQIREWEKKTKEQSKNMGGVNQSAQQNVKTQREVKKLENQLENANNKFSNSLEENKDLREQIDSLQVERERFDNLYKKLDKELQQLREEIGEVIDQSTQAYDQRDDAQAKMMMLKEKAEKDLQQHNAEMKELVRIIDHDRKLREFMNTKTKERQEDEQMAGWRNRKEEQEAAKKKASQTDSVESYEEAFKRIRENTGEEDIDDIVRKFIEVEDQNFALYSYCSELSNKIEKLEDDIREINNDIENFQKEDTKMEEERKRLMTILEEESDQCSKKADEADEHHKEVNKILDQLQAGVDSLFSKINCDRSSIEDMLGADAGVNETNMIQYLGIIENRTNQLLTMQTFVENKKEAEHDQIRKNPRLLGPGPQPSFIMRTVTPPSVGDDYDSDGSRGSDEDKPMTQDQLRDRAKRNAIKREQAKKKEGHHYDSITDGRDQKKAKDKGKKH